MCNVYAEHQTPKRISMAQQGIWSKLAVKGKKLDLALGCQKNHVVALCRDISDTESECLFNPIHSQVEPQMVTQHNYGTKVKRGKRVRKEGRRVRWTAQIDSVSSSNNTCFLFNKNSSFKTLPVECLSVDTDPEGVIICFFSLIYFKPTKLTLPNSTD